MIATGERGFGYQASFLNPFVCCSLAKLRPILAFCKDQIRSIRLVAHDRL